MSNPRKPVVVFATLGANPAPLVQLVWALHRRCDSIPVHILVVVDRRGHEYLHAEVLRAGAAWDRLRSALDREIVSSDQVIELVAQRENGEAIPSDDLPEDAVYYNETAWRGARRAIELAGEMSVIFGLVAGRRRTMHVATTVLFQLLARPQDRLVDVRLSERWAHEPGAFYFPGTVNTVRCRGERGPTAAPSSVEISLLDAQVPRLRGLLRERDISSYGAAMRAGQAAIDESSAPSLVIDLTQGKAFLNQEDLDLSPVRFIWFANLAIGRKTDTQGDGWVKARDYPHFWTTVRACSRHIWFEFVKSELVTKISELTTPINYEKESEEEATLKKLRTDTKTHLEKFFKGRSPHVAALVVPVLRRRKTPECYVGMQRLAMSPDSIQIIGLPTQ